MKKSILFYLLSTIVSILIYLVSYNFSESTFDVNGRLDYFFSESTQWLDILRWLVPGLIVGYISKGNVLYHGLVLGVLIFTSTILTYDILYESKKVVFGNLKYLILIIGGFAREVLMVALATVCGRYLADKK